MNTCPAIELPLCNIKSILSPLLCFVVDGGSGVRRLSGIGIRQSAFGGIRHGELSASLHCTDCSLSVLGLWQLELAIRPSLGETETTESPRWMCLAAARVVSGGHLSIRATTWTPRPLPMSFASSRLDLLAAASAITWSSWKAAMLHFRLCSRTSTSWRRRPRETAGK